ncbi:uncharacterized protein ACIBXB_006478 [Morphnus guianensis]
MLPEVYEIPTSSSLKDKVFSPSLRETENEKEGKLSPPGAMAQFSLLPSISIPGPSSDLPTRGILVVKILDKNPSCPCCGNTIGKMSGLIKHLKRTHGKKKIPFQCAQCGRTSVKHHSIACHLPKCKGAMEAALVEGWKCEECKRTSEMKISLEQHKRLVHPVTRNIEWIAATCPKKGTARGVHQQCWTEEEVELLWKLDKQYERSKNINKLIAEHILSKTAKLVSDKRRGLHKTLVKRREKDQDWTKHLEKEWEHLVNIGLQVEEGLRSHYRRVISEWVASEKLPILQGTFEKVIEGKEDPSTGVDEAIEDYYSCPFMKSTELEASQS